jgi:enamine deaminase RidA (YjgF/YER057c/UK114 family)
LAAIAGEFAYISGQGPFTPEGELLTGSFEEQARRTFANVLAITTALGGTVADVARVGIYLQDMKTDFAQMNTIYAEFFPEPFPARTTIPTPQLRFGLEVDAVIWLGGGK